MGKLRRGLINFYACAMVWLALCAAIGVTSAELALHPAHRALTTSDSVAAQEIAAQDDAALRLVSISADDGAVLRAWEFEPLHKNGNAVLLLHGQSDNRAGMLGSAELMLRRGYMVLLTDARAHGASGGSIATYGVLERHDIHDWVDFLRSNENPRCVDGLGDSMGAAQLLQSLTTVPDFCAVVAESPFADFREAAFDRIGQQFGTGPWLGRTLLRPAIELGFLYARIRYQVDLTLAAPDKSVALSQVPVLLIHGKIDTNLPPRHSEKIIRLSRGFNPNVGIWEPSNAGHCGAASADPVEYENRVLSWFATHDQAKDASRMSQQLRQ